jgi:hypothetical protein
MALHRRRGRERGSPIGRFGYHYCLLFEPGTG